MKIYFKLFLKFLLKEKDLLFLILLPIFFSIPRLLLGNLFILILSIFCTLFTLSSQYVIWEVNYYLTPQVVNLLWNLQNTKSLNSEINELLWKEQQKKGKK